MTGIGRKSWFVSSSRGSKLESQGERFVLYLLAALTSAALGRASASSRRAMKRSRSRSLRVVTSLCSMTERAWRTSVLTAKSLSDWPSEAAASSMTSLRSAGSRKLSREIASEGGISKGDVPIARGGLGNPGWWVPVLRAPGGRATISPTTAG